MAEPFKRLPDVDSVHGMQVTGQIVEIQYENVAEREHYVMSMTLPNALNLLVLLSQLPGAGQTLERARAFAKQHPSG